MKNGEAQIIGVKQYTSKTGKKATIIHYMTPFDDYDSETSDKLDGFQTGNEFTYLDIANDLKVGDIVAFRYGKGFKGAAQLNGIDIIKVAQNAK